MNRRQLAQSAVLIACSAWTTKATGNVAYCPVCKEKGKPQDLGVVAAGNRDPYFGMVGWIPSLTLWRCETCGVLFSTKRES